MMRFFADGPIIPDELLAERDRGNVVFLCGAGISMPGLPSFPQLARRVMERLRTPPDSKALRQFKAMEESKNYDGLDRVFSVLEDEYRRAHIDHAVREIVKTPRKPNTRNHSILLRLSRNAERIPRLVTTNFDTLFERVDRRLRKHVSPALPDLVSLNAFEGVVYLHGRRVLGASEEELRLVLTSADFGRAYLSDGWATRFMRELLRNYVIVLVGYSASDPPVRYLLEGLRSRKEDSAPTIFAFDQGEPDEVRARWRGLGVEALAYRQSSDPRHPQLWNTLEAWAQWADDPDAGRRSIVLLAQQRPSTLEAFQRGQVASLVRTVEGAALFASATPAPPAEWLCTFDRQIRYFQSQRPNADKVDGQQRYGLDDDPARPPQSPNGRGIDAVVGDDLLSLRHTDERTDRYKRLAGTWTLASDPLPPRLFHLSHWISRSLSDPLAAWWAAGYPVLHRDLLRRIERVLEQGETDARALGSRLWRLLLERFHHAPEGNHENPWYRFLPRVKQEGWTELVLLAFEEAIRPYVVAKRPYEFIGREQDSEDAPTSLGAFVDFDVQFSDAAREPVEIPTEVLPRVFATVRRALERGSVLLAEADKRYFHTASFEPDDGNDPFLDDASRFLHWARRLFDRLASEHPTVARQEFRLWSANDPFFFAKLKIYGARYGDIIPGEDASNALLTLSQECFWNEYHRRELLRTLHARWVDFSEAMRRQIEERILAGGYRWANEADEEFQLRKIETADAVLGWLARKGCELSPQATEALGLMRENIPGWRASWEERADASFDIRSRWVATKDDPAVLRETPLADVVAVAEAHTRREHEHFVEQAPFQGLVQQYPRRALAALSLQARRGQYPTWPWRTLISRWPKESSDRLNRACAGRIMRLPDVMLAGLLYDATDWFGKHARRLGAAQRSSALNLFDRLADLVSVGGAEATTSGIGEVIENDRVQSRHTRDHALNSVVGHLLRGLIEMMGSDELTASAGIPRDFTERFERLLRMPGDGAHHATCELSLQLRWLFYIDPAWTRRQIIPLFSAGHKLSEAAWNGLLDDSQLPQASLFKLLKPSFLKVFDRAAEWVWRDDAANTRLGERLVAACYWHLRDRRYVTYAEAGQALRKLDDRGRSHVLWTLTSIVRDHGEWRRFGKPFLQRAWPLERRFQTPTVAVQCAHLAEASGDDFPDVVQTILPLLVPSTDLDLVGYRASSVQEPSLASRFPEATLVLFNALVPTTLAYAPFGLAQNLESIASVSPSLREDPRWRRLNKIVRGG
jgi:hypothetical protein